MSGASYTLRASKVFTLAPAILGLFLFCLLFLGHTKANADLLFLDSATKREVAGSISNIPRTATAIWNDLTSDRSCVACQGILFLLKTLASAGDRAFVRGMQEICALSLQSADREVCDGTFSISGPLLANTLRGMTLGSRNSDLFCSSVLGLCNFPQVEAGNISFPERLSKTQENRPPSTSQVPQRPIKIAHFSDLHIDNLYTPGANANCTKPMCCRSYTPADAPGNNDAPAGPFGDHNCGAPLRLENSMYAAIQALSPEFSIFTGDIVDHAIWSTSVEHNSAEIKTAYQHMAEHDIGPVYGAVGNHEMSPFNALSPKHLGNSADWLYKVINRAWSRWIGSQPDVEALGVYSVKATGTNLRIISLSTNMWYTLNWFLYQQPRQDPGDELARLVRELDAAEKAGERVYLVGHMPLGASDSFHDASNYFDQIVNRYKDTIAAMFYGHTHLDHFQLSYCDYGNRRADNAVAMSYIAPSVTPLSGMPAFRIYTVDPVTFGVMDVETYYANMEDQQFQQGPKWEKYYSARETYASLLDPSPESSSPMELTPAFWHNVTLLLESDPAAFDEYRTRRTRGWNVPECDEACRKNDICQLRAARSQDNCFVPSPGASLGIRQVDRPDEVRGLQCDRSAVSDTLGSIIVRKSLLELLDKKVHTELRLR
ncbi:Metallo-dependent phosphatase-like protein [Plectosphaerella plurivora]|uniref:Sphingomyelin phosphodiesterase n=1 Tax=Plectosphaerella plurivora TaxID=936078 RepID=A0A9P9A4Q0_9PEZI|nr:Metallo-dependent phosphatase-like protein [Plectosphaerella plurivora]